jgi:CRP-like cAMP-binding protein
MTQSNRRPRVREAGLVIGEMPTGTHNAITDVVGVRVMMLVATGISLAGGLVAMVSPGIGRPAAEWLKAISILRKAGEAPELSAGRIATLADMERLIGRLPALSGLSAEDRNSLLKEMRYIDAPEGVAIVRTGETSDAAYFILEGRAVAGREENGRERILEVLNPGDFFGEIAALTGVPRTANVVTDQPATLLRVPATTLREMSKNPELNRIFTTKMTERMLRMNMIELPR